MTELADGMTLRLAGVELLVDHAPGHTPGSVTFRLGPGTCSFSGDLLFAGSIGRTDLPGGDYPTILDSLARVCLTLPDETVVLSGHGPQTTIGAERASNPFLAGLAAGPGSPAWPGTGQPAASGCNGCDDRERLTKAMIRTHEAGTLRAGAGGRAGDAGRLGGAPP